MDVMQILPDDILRKQVCQECYNYLSVPPVVINNKGESICGRCVGLAEHDGPKTKSFFNIIAAGFYFKCVNHFNGCTKTLAFEETQSHEKECPYSESQECVYCPFSGNLSQIFNHAVKIHPENVSLDGIIPLPLSNQSLKKIIFLPIEDNLLVVRIELTDYLFRIALELVTKKLPLNINQYAMKFYKPEDKELGQFSISLENTVEKPKEELVKIFGQENIHCQILMDAFTLEKKEFELHRRILDLRRSEENVTNLKRKLQIERDELLQQRESYDLAKKVFKKMSCNLFKCSKCQKAIFAETFFCPKNHCCCKSCLSRFCDVCKVVRDFSKLPSLGELTVSCDWPGCNVNVCIEDFWSHKTGCKFRPYKCPLHNCNEIIFSIGKLREHWHASSPILDDPREIICNKYGCEEYYWILNNDIYHLFINFDENCIKAYVEEYNVLQDAVKFECIANVQVNGTNWHKLKMSEFCGRYQIEAENYIILHSRSYKYQIIKIRLEDQWEALGL